ncbi:hypothetical protein [Butyrivibrio fibrisolvens]|uniref:hypothetical protein n=1 Tax=Butyrivibrio fibrisolvens TaxID=831 RepID=UPI0003B765E5|nr:hypothetical protein [Butyrivibrio fibrisolvens]
MDGTRNYYREAEEILKRENPEMDSYSMFVRLQDMKRNAELRDYVEKKNREAHRTEELYHNEEKVTGVEKTEEKDYRSEADRMMKMLNEQERQQKEATRAENEAAISAIKNKTGVIDVSSPSISLEGESKATVTLADGTRKGITFDISGEHDQVPPIEHINVKAAYASREGVIISEKDKEASAKDSIGKILESASPELLRNIHDAGMKEQAEMVLYYHALNEWKDKDMADALAYDMSDDFKYSDFDDKQEPDLSILNKNEKMSRDEPHSSIVILKSEHDMDNLSDILNKSVQDFADDRAQGKDVPEIALLDENRAAIGKMPIDKYLEEKVQADSKSSLAMLIDSINNGTTSITHSELPEACFTVLEDGDSKGQVAWAGSIIGEEKYESDRNMDMTVVYYSQMDNTLVKENALSGEREALMLEAYEEEIDLIGGMSFAELDAAESEKIEAKKDYEAAHPKEEEKDNGEFFTPYTDGWEPADEFDDDEYI